MSQHKIELTDIERKGLEMHRLPIGTPSQLSDSFRNGVAWALSNNYTALELEQVKRERDEALDKGKKYDFICSFVTESICQQRSEFSALKTKYVLPTMIAYADFCGQISFDDALNILMTQHADKLRQGGE